MVELDENREKRNASQKGFTLLELLVVVAVISLLAMIAIPTYQNYVARAVLTETVNQLDQYTTQASEYYQVNGELPTFSDVGFSSWFATYQTIYGEQSDVWNLVLYYTTSDRERAVVLYYSKTPHRFGTDFWQVAMLFRTNNGYFESICTSNTAARVAVPQTCHNSLLNWNW